MYFYYFKPMNLMISNDTKTSLLSHSTYELTSNSKNTWMNHRLNIFIIHFGNKIKCILWQTKIPKQCFGLVFWFGVLVVRFLMSLLLWFTLIVVVAPNTVNSFLVFYSIFFKWLWHLNKEFELFIESLISKVNWLDFFNKSMC